MEHADHLRAAQRYLFAALGFLVLAVSVLSLIA